MVTCIVIYIYRLCPRYQCQGCTQKHMPISPNRPTQQQHSKGIYKPIKQPVLDLIVHWCETYQGIVFWYGCTHSVQKYIDF